MRTDPAYNLLQQQIQIDIDAFIKTLVRPSQEQIIQKLTQFTTKRSSFLYQLYETVSQQPAKSENYQKLMQATKALAKRNKTILHFINTQLARELAKDDLALYTLLPHTLRNRVDRPIPKTISNTEPQTADNASVNIRWMRALSKEQDVEHYDELFARWQLFLKNKALDHTATNNNYRFDISGRRLVDLRLIQGNNNYYHEFLTNCGIEVSKDDAKAMLCRKLGLNHENENETIHASVDIRDNQALQTAFKDWIGKPELANKILKLNTSQLLPICEELEMHTRLVVRTLRNHQLSSAPANYAITNHGWEFIHEQTIKELHQEIQSRLDQCPTTNSQAINKFFDTQRKSLYKLSHQLIVNHIEQQLNASNNQPATNNTGAGAGASSQSQQTKAHTYLTQYNTMTDADFSHTTASPSDYLRYDRSLGTITYREGSHISAHNTNATQNAYQATRTAMIHQDEQGLEIATAVKKFRMRVPSLSNFNVKQANSYNLVDHVKEKFVIAMDKFQRQYGDDEFMLTYNCLLSNFNVAAASIGDRKNHQRKQVARSLHALHLFNADQYHDNRPLCMIQVMGVNQEYFAQGLGYDTFTKSHSTQEATLMSEFALLNTLSYVVVDLPIEARSVIKSACAAVKQEYENFLSSGPRSDDYFIKQSSGQMARKHIEHAQQQLQKILPSSQSNNGVHSEAATTLMRLFANNTHHQKQYGTLIQSLSVYLQPASMYGCKSANERYMMVAGRVEALESLDTNMGNQQQKVACKLAFKRFSRGEIKAQTLQNALDRYYNNHVYSSSAAVALADMGAPSKVKVFNDQSNKQGSWFANPVNKFDSNYAETGLISNLKTNGAKSVQPHKSNIARQLRKMANRGQSNKSQPANTPTTRAHTRLAH